MKTKALSLLKRYYGYDAFRPGQWDVISHAITGRDTLVLMPTGGGKSLCYQIPALLLPGCTIVVSPLIALMNDQVQALRANGIEAGAIHSNQDEAFNRENFRLAASGKLKLLYISPERLMMEIQSLSSTVKVAMVAIDEAHCISQWGHDFRPVYTSLKAVKSTFPGIPVMALTATADRLTRLDIADALGLHDPFRWIGSFDRPNISLTVVNDPGKRQRLKIIASLIQKYRLDSGIVYCLSRKKTESMHEELTKMGFRSVCYHAGLPANLREAAQRAFVNGEAQVVCATIAFGMGIDKSNIRWVVHNNIPGNIESYYQEIGRAGRDGLPAEAILFYNYGDIITRRSFAEESGQREINSEKLDFMQRYAEASVCRRRILLSYFSEERNCDCGNCDNCRAPRARFDGTILAQKALSAVIRINAQEGMNIIIDILRASNRADIYHKGYHQIKTYGAGRDLSSREWHSYLLQMVQLGLFEVAYEDNFHLRPTPFGMKVLRGEEHIQLSRYVENSYGSFNKKSTLPVVEKTPEEKLTDILKEVRREISVKQNIPAYMVFSDASLQDMVAKRPTDLDEFARVSGVGDLKLSKYGRPFISAIRKFQGLKASLPPGSSQKETLLLFESGQQLEEIAQFRGLSPMTVATHLADWIDKDRVSDFRRLMSLREYDIIISELKNNPEGAYENLKNNPDIRMYLVPLAKAEARYRERHHNS